MGARQSSGAENLAQVAPMPDPATQEEVEGFAEAISRTGEVVCFDMDQCIVAQHSRGRLRKDELEHFLSRVTPDFKALVPELDKRGVKLAITTHSDKAEYNTFVRPETHVIGEDLVEAVLASSVPAHASKFKVVAFNPNVRYHVALPFMPHMIGKKHHVREVCAHYGISSISDAILFDDDEINVAMTEGCVAIKVDPMTGFSVVALKEPMLLAEQRRVVSSAGRPNGAESCGVQTSATQETVM